ncbi:hypothetical protein L9F63_018540, partial [Diploptera punctata]
IFKASLVILIGGRSMDGERGMAFGFRKTAAAEMIPDGDDIYIYIYIYMIKNFSWVFRVIDSRCAFFLIR